MFSTKHIFNSAKGFSTANKCLVCGLWVETPTSAIACLGRTHPRIELDWAFTVCGE